MQTNSRYKIPHERLIDETKSLISTIGGETERVFIQKRETLDPRFAVGKGKLEEIRNYITEKKRYTVLFDLDLNPSQARNIEDYLKVPIMDRSELIMEIFSNNAKTEIAKTQVELAYLEYLRPRLKGMWGHFSRITARGKGSTRGPGEKQLETDRRELSKRISILKEQLKKREIQRQTQRKQRKNLFNIILVGYTNAGKSTLINRLTSSSVFSSDRVFSTLDPSTRRFYIKERNQTVTFTDTVGFIRGLPHQLIASFHATLMEIEEADLLLHVIDGSAPDYNEQKETVIETMKILGAENIPMIEIINKIDLNKDIDTTSFSKDSIFISAKEGIGIDDLWSTLLGKIPLPEYE